MRGILASAAGLLLRRRSCSGPLLLVGVAVCLFYQTLMVARNRLRSADVRRRKATDELVIEEIRGFISTLETSLTQHRGWAQYPPQRRRAVVLKGEHQVSDGEVQLYQQVLQQMDYEVQMSRYAETSSFLRTNQGVGGWSLLLCLSSSERSCLRRVSFTHLQGHQKVNLVPGLMESFSDAGGGLCQFYTHSHLKDLPMRPYSCGSANHELQIPPDRNITCEHRCADPRLSDSLSPGLFAEVNVYVLVTSTRPLTSFLHDIIVVTTARESPGRRTELRNFLLQLGPSVSHQTLGQIKKVIGEVLQAAVLTNERRPNLHRCLLCYQLLTVTLLFSGSITPMITQVDTELTFPALTDNVFERQITKDQILEDTLRFTLMSQPFSDTGGRRYGSCRGTNRVCLSEDEFLLLLQFQQQMKTFSSFQLLSPGASCPSSSWSPRSVSDLLVGISCYYELHRNGSFRTDGPDVTSQDRSPGGRDPTACVDPHLRRIYSDPPLALTPPFSPWVKRYRAEVPFDTVTIRIRPEPIASTCRVHLDEHGGPRMANYPVGLGDSRISILVTDGGKPQPITTVYTVQVRRESRPSLPMFGDHVTCSFVQDCGLLVQPGRACGLQPFIGSLRPLQTCTSGHTPGQWVVPCLSCADNRTCDWRDVAWQPDGCSHQLVDRPQLQRCMMDRKVLFIGDSTNRGMMFFLMEQVNSSLQDWGKAHDMLVYRNLNGGRTQVSYSYYPRFWLEQKRRPTFRQALLQLLERSRPLVNSNLTVLVVGGVQWLNTEHLRTVREVLDREGLANILVVVKSLGIGFHLPVDGIRSLSSREVQDLYMDNANIIATAKHHGYEVVDTFSITMGRYKEFLQGRCACHFHEVEKLWSVQSPSDATSTTNRFRLIRTGSGLRSPTAVQESESGLSTFHVKGPVNQVYSEILLSRLCSSTRS